MTRIKSSLFISKLGKVWNFMIQSSNKQNCFFFHKSPNYRSKKRKEPLLPCVVIRNHFLWQFINFIHKLFNDLMPNLMVFFNLIFLKQIGENVNILNSEIHSSVSQWRMNMSCISSEINISDVHFFNDSVIDEELRPPTYVENVKFF